LRQKLHLIEEKNSQVSRWRDYIAVVKSPQEKNVSLYPLLVYHMVVLLDANLDLNSKEDIFH